MRDLSTYLIEIIGLKNTDYQFNWEIEDIFFRNFEESLIEKGSLACSLKLSKKETFIEMHFTIEGSVDLVCDRSLDHFDYPISEHKKMLFKYGEEDREIDDEVEMISRNRQNINVAQYIYEYIATAVPLKKLHPRYGTEDEQGETLVYTTDRENQEKDDNNISETDPRWEVLKNLKNNLN